MFKKLYILIFFFVLNSNLNAIENKIVLKIDEEIVTSIDVKAEENYLKALNPGIKNLSSEKLNNIAKNSLIKEKIKKKEILKYIENIKLNDNYLDQLIEQRYSRLNLRNTDQFSIYLKTYEIDINTIKEKISIEALWNQLIYQKFSKNLKINIEKLKKELIEKFKKDEKNFLLSEIVFNINNNENLNAKYSEIIKNIQEENFETTALIYSISDSSNIGGKIGWIKEKSLNKKIKDQINNLKINDISKPISTPNGYLILKIDDIKFIKNEYDKDIELKNLIKSKKNQQLNQHSIIYFNKIKKDFLINEI